MARGLILASQSPRRKALLEQVGLTFEVYSADVDESAWQNESVEDYVQRIATLKATTVATHFPQSIVIAADTTVTIDGHILTKPKNRQDAFRMWTLLSGRSHQVKTTVVVAYASHLFHDTVTTVVYFKDLTEVEMLRYWQTGEPQDKAGAYAIQGYAAAWITRIEGSYSSVVGLPLYETLQLITQAQMIK